MNLIDNIQSESSHTDCQHSSVKPDAIILKKNCFFYCIPFIRAVEGYFFSKGDVYQVSVLSPKFTINTWNCPDDGYMGYDLENRFVDGNLPEGKDIPGGVKCLPSGVLEFISPVTGSLDEYYSGWVFSISPPFNKPCVSICICRVGKPVR